ncbi:MAG: archaeal proteasome endopeptidase complex subunit beta [Candidatus Aenigmarchaeota archaeon]|nr:archaeal proteasome endopeptidase complex subunit beta [Candidatus Aenigmarchaeota archaeon]
MSENKKTGTTTVGILVKDAVIIATDQKASMGYMVASKRSQKLFQLDDHIGMTIAGTAADALAIVRILRAQFKLYKLERGPITLKAAATLLSNILHGSKYFPYLNQFILAGYDNKPHVYSFDPLGAFDERESFHSTGSGSPFVYGVLEDQYKPNMSVEQGVELVKRAIKAAVERDIASGGKEIEIAVIDKNGFRLLPPEPLK